MMWAMILIVGVLMVMATDTAGNGGTAADAGGSGEDGEGGAQVPALQADAEGKYSQEQVDVLLGKERDRLDIKAKDTDKRFEDEVKKRVEEEKTRAEMSELQKAQTDLAAAEAERDRLKQEAEAQTARAERQQFIAMNAGDLDRAWRTYLEQQLAQAGDDETPEQVLARVEKERDDEQGGTGTSLGVAGRPAGQPGTGKPGGMNRAIRRAAGRKA